MPIYPHLSDGAYFLTLITFGIIVSLVEKDEIID